MNMKNVFYNCNSLESLNVFNWNIDEVLDISNMFYNCSKLTTLDVSNWNTDKVTNMSGVFYNCNELITLDLSGWNVDDVTDMSLLFFNCFNLESIGDTTNWNTSNLVNINGIFNNCYKLISLDLSNWDTRKVVGESTQLFGGWVPSQTVYISKRWTTDVTSYNATFIKIITYLHTFAKYTFDNSIGDCLPIINGVDTSRWEYADVVNDTITTRTIGTDEDIDENFKITSYSFNENESLLTIENLKIDNNITLMSNMFSHCSNLTSINTKGWDTSNVTSMNNVFYNCRLISSLDVSHFDTKKVVNINGMFYNCRLLSSLNLNKWNTNEIINMGGAFRNCYKLTSLDISNWNTDKTTDMESLFDGCQLLTSLDLSNWNMSKVVHMNNMFTNCNNIRKIKLLNCIPFTIESIINSLPTKKVNNVGYLFTRDNYENDKYWENIVCKDFTHSIYLPQQLKITDELYWDDERESYCIKQNSGNIISLNNLNKKIFFNTYKPTTGISCNNSIEKPNRILFQSDIVKYAPTILMPSTKYTIQFNCKTNNYPIIFRIDSVNIEVQAKIGINKLDIITPSNIIDNNLYIIGKEDEISEIMFIEGETNQTPNYFDGESFVGIEQENGMYKIKITTSTARGLKKQSFTIITSTPFGKNDKIYWSDKYKTYVIDRNGKIEVTTIEEDVSALPRLYQREDSYLKIDTDNIKPSKIKIQYRDIK